jgi:hypothetical protein
VNEVDPIWLSGGGWRPRGGIMVWVPNPPPEHDTRQKRQTMDERTVMDEPEVACDRCGAKQHESCRTTGGNTTADHKERRLPKTCICGRKLAPRKRYCGACREASYATSQIEHMRRRRAAQKDRQRRGDSDEPGSEGIASIPA